MVQFSSLYRELLSIELGNSDTAALFTIARRKAAVNKGLQEFADLTECFQRDLFKSWPGGAGSVSLSTWVTAIDYSRPSKRPVSFRYTDAAGNQTILEGNDLPRRDPPWLSIYRSGWDFSTVTSTSGQILPEFYYFTPHGNDLFLGFTPVPSTGSSASIDVNLPYVARPAVLTSDTQEPFTVLSTQSGENLTVRYDLRPYHQALVHFGAAKLELLRRDVGASQTQMQTFLSYVARYLGQQRQKGGAVVSYVRNYFRVRGADRGVDPRV